MKTAIVEIRESHEECIYSQLRFLKDAGHEVSLILHPVLAPQISDYAHLADDIRYFDFDSCGFFQNMALQRRLFQTLGTFDLLVLNTAHSFAVMRNLTVLLRWSRTECIGVLHDTNKLVGSFTQNIISKKVRKYFVLNDALLPSNKIAGDIKVQSFYPIFFPEYPSVPINKHETIWIGIPGRVDYTRRDYDLLIDALAKITDLRRVTFLILGKVDRKQAEGGRLYGSIEKSGQLARFKLFSSFIANAYFHAYLGACDYVMPLLRPDEAYFKHKISGTFNLAFAHKKTLLCQSFLKDIPDLKTNARFFDPESLPQLIKAIDAGNFEFPDSYSNPKWQYSFQQKRYIDFVNE